jgi:hypothetical protein
MKTLVKLAIPLALAGASYAENWNAKLLDSTCADKNGSSSTPTTQNSDRKSREALAKNCAPTASTTTYAIEASDGKVYKLDSAGNTKVASEMQAGAIKPDRDGDVHVKVGGTLQGDTIKVDTVSHK